MSFALSPFRIVTSLVFASAVALFAAAGCSQQAEGERCDKAKNGDADCDSGLICVPKAELLEQITDRCCRPSTTDQSDDRCTRQNETSINNPTPIGGAGGADSGTAGSDSGGAPDQGGTAGTTSQGGTSGGGTGGTNASGAAGAPAEPGSAGAANAGAGGAP